MAESAKQALAQLRDTSNFSWYIIPIFIFVFYVYAVEVEKKNWNVLFAGLAFWGMDVFNEIWNGLVFHFTEFAPVWGTPTKSAFEIFIGLNIEISLMFLVAGIACAKMLPKDKKAKILGIPNRLFLAVFNSILFVLVECLLNNIGVLTWEYWWWQPNFPFVLFLIGYMPFLVACYWVHDMDTVKKKIIAVGTIFSVDAIAIILFSCIPRWI